MLMKSLVKSLEEGIEARRLRGNGHMTRHYHILSLFLSSLLLYLGSGCGLFPAGNQNTPGGGQNNQNPPSQGVPTVNIDGNWRHEASGGINATCLTIQNTRISAMDDGCDGTPLTLLASPQAQANASGITLFVGFGATPGDTLNGGIYTYMVMLMPDGTLQGTVILRLEPSGPITTAPVTLVRQ